MRTPVDGCEILRHQKDGWNPINNGINMDKPTYEKTPWASHLMVTDFSIRAYIVSICGTQQSKIWSIIISQLKMQPPWLNKAMLEMAPFSKVVFSEDPECKRVPIAENGTSASSHPHLAMFRGNNYFLPTFCVVCARARLGLTGWWFRLVVSLSGQWCQLATIS